MNSHQGRKTKKIQRATGASLAPGADTADKEPSGHISGEVTAARKAIGLCMVVKNESHVILRCLESVRKLIEYVLIEDTGSTDGTQAIIRDWLHRQGIPGEVFDEPWRDFAHNRSIALARLRERKDVDYALMIDADDVLVVEPWFDAVAFKKDLSADEYRVEMRNGPLRYRRSQICSNRREYRYRGVLHEFLESPPGNISTGTAVGFHIISNREGARNQDPDKYAKDAQILERALREETDPSLCCRYTFYLARSYHFAGEKENALANYLKRADLGHWVEEVFISLYAAAEILEGIGRPIDEVIATYLRASDVAPHRAEALHAASRLCRENKKYADGFDYAWRGLKIGLPADGLFIQPWIYDWGLLDELGVNAYWTGRYTECIDACNRLLDEGKLPAEHRDRIVKNKNFALDKLREAAPPPAVKTDDFLNLLQAARKKEELGSGSNDEIIAAYIEATAAFPARAEALHGAARFCRTKSIHQQGYEFATKGLAIAYPKDAREVEDWIYDYGLLDELAVNAYWVGNYDDCLTACERLLQEGKIPAEHRGRIEQNARLAREKIASRVAEANNEKANSSLPLSPRQQALPLIASPRPASEYPRVLLAILAKQAEKVLSFYLRCIEALDYPKKSIVLYIRSNNNTDKTVDMLNEWLGRIRSQYAHIEFDVSDVTQTVEKFGIHEWNAMRFRVLAAIRQESMNRALLNGCHYYFVVDTDNFLRPTTLKNLISVNLPIVAPLLRCSDAQHQQYSNFHDNIDARGYAIRRDEYWKLLNQEIKGLIEVPVVHCTYLVRSDVIPRLYFQDGSDRHEYVIFSESARRSEIPQYLDTRQIYGYVTLENDPQDAMKLIGPQIGSAILAGKKSGRPRIFACFGLHSSGSTWMFNLVREICRTQGIELVSLHRDSEANLPWDELGRRLIVVRTHNPFPSFQLLIAGCGEPAVITVRDPRDAVVSLMQRFPNSEGASFHEAVKAVAHSAETLVALSRLRQIPIFRYEDGFVGNIQTFDRIAELLDAKPSESDRTTILAGLSPEAVRTTIRGLEAAGAIRGEAVWDKETHWHANHVGDGRLGKFKGSLTPAHEREILERMHEFCEFFGYA